MDWLIEILVKFKVLLTTVVTVIPLAIIFRQQIAEVIASVTSIEIDPKKRRWKVNFGQRIQQEQKRATVIPRQITASRAVPPPTPAVSGAKQSGREMVFEAFGAVKQAMYNACMANDIPITPTMGIREAVRRLGNAKGLSADLIKLIDMVYELGQEVASDSGLRPEDDDARAYWYLAYAALNWLDLSTLAPKEPVKEATEPAPPRRATVVGGDFVQPRQGSAAATLIGIGGPVRGQRFSIDKPHYRMGRSSNNDLRISADDSVSGDHAYLRFEKGGLFLFDQSSLNGTYLNEQRITEAPLMVRHGDRIRLGESVFEVAGASPNPRPSEEKVETLKGPSDRSIVR